MPAPKVTNSWCCETTVIRALAESRERDGLIARLNATTGVVALQSVSSTMHLTAVRGPKVRILHALNNPASPALTGGPERSRPLLCQDCPKKPTCLSLCPEAESFVDQDTVIQSELIPGNADVRDVGVDPFEYGLDIRNSGHLKALILQLYDDGLSTREIAYHLPCSQQYVVLVINGDTRGVTSKIETNISILLEIKV